MGRRRRWMALVLAACGAPGACSSFDSGETAALDDAGLSPDADVSDAAADAPPDDAEAPDASAARCDPARSFSPPVFVPGLDVGANDIAAHLSADELQIIFSSNRGLPAGSGNHLWSSSRTTVAAAFTDASALPGIHDAGINDYWGTAAPWTSAYLYLCSTRPNNTFNNVFTTFVTDAGTYALPSVVPALAGKDLCHAHAARHAEELWLSNTSGTADIYRVAHLPDGGFGQPVAVTELNTTARDYEPVLSDDGLVVYWGSTRQDKNFGSTDIWVATRADTSAPFGSARNVAEVNTASDEMPSWLSPDQCRLYMTSNRSGHYQLLVASRSP